MTNYKKQLIEIAKEYKIPLSIVDQIYNSQFLFAKEVIEQLEVKGKTKEELEKLKTNFNYKYLGKLYAAPGNLKKHKTGE